MGLIKFLIIFHTITVDGNITDWIGTPPLKIHDYTFSNGEFIYKGDLNDYRTDLGNTLYLDLTEFRLTCDNNWMYFLIKFQDIGPSDKDSIHVEISLGNPADPTSYNWIGDDAQLGLSNRALADRIIALHSTSEGNFDIELWDGGICYSPPTSGYLAVISDVNDCIEARISLNDIADGSLHLPSAIRITLVIFKNVVGWNNDIDATQDIGGFLINDAIDVMGGKVSINENAWFRDLNDNKVDKFFDILLNKVGNAIEFTRKIDGDFSDWIGSLPSNIHETVISKNEWIYRGDTSDMRQDPAGEDRYYDLTELRLTCDSVNLYILAKFYKMIFEETQIAISLDIDSNSYDDKLIQNGDDTGTLLGSNVQYSEREILLTADSVNHSEIFLFADDGFLWYNPVSPYKIVIDPFNKTLEARIELVDLNLNPQSRMIISAATYDANVQGIGNSPNGSDDPNTPIEEGDMSVDYNVCDAIDVVGGNVGQRQSSWDRDLSDGDIDFYYVIRIQNIIQPLGTEDEFLYVENLKDGILIKYSLSTGSEIKILRKDGNSDFKEIFRTNIKRGSYFDRNVVKGVEYTYILKSEEKFLGPIKIKYEGRIDNVKVYNFDSLYLSSLIEFKVIDLSGRERLLKGKGMVRFPNFKKGVYFIRADNSTYKILKIK